MSSEEPSQTSEPNDAPLPSVEGELTPAPHGAAATAVLALVGWLLVARVVRLVAKGALAYRRPAAVTLTRDAVVVHTSTEILGRKLRDREIVIPRGALFRATRDARLPGLAIYAGLAALAAGSFVGVGLVVDGVRAASASMIGFGALVVALGVSLDFALSSLAPTATGRCRVVLVPRRGAVVCVGGVPVGSADDLLRAIASP